MKDVKSDIQMEQQTISTRPSYNVTSTEISSTLGKSRSGISYVIQKFEETGTTQRRKGSDPKIKFDDTVRNKILDFFKADSRATYKDCIR